MDTQPFDRREKLRLSATRNGVDFVTVIAPPPGASPPPPTLRVRFLNGVTLTGTVKVRVRGGVAVPEVSLKDIAAGDFSAGPPLELTLTPTREGDFSEYTLTVESDNIDPFFASATFVFRPDCAVGADCEEAPPDCPTPERELPPIDYLAKDYEGFRAALLDFSAARTPEWAERSESDFGVMFLEALAAVADNLSYLQDRVAAEAFLETATQRVSLMRLARLVDYAPAPALAARADLRLTAAAPATLTLGQNGPFAALTRDGLRIPFEIGDGLADAAEYRIDPRWNRLIPYLWDERDLCLKAGAMEVTVEGATLGLKPGDRLILETTDDNDAETPVREIVVLAEATDMTDPLANNAPVTKLTLAAPCRFDHPLFWTPRENERRGLPAQYSVRTIIGGNIIPATAGRRVVERFVIPGGASAAGQNRAFARVGADDAPDSPSRVYRYPLSETPLAYLKRGGDGAGTAEIQPEIRLEQVSPEAHEWDFLPSLLKAELFQRAFAVDAARYRIIGRSGDIPHYEYDGDDGFTIRFGEGVFGETPEAGAVFQATYRAGAGASGNVAADTIVETPADLRTTVSAVTNPLPAFGGEEAETAEQIRRRAPQDFRATQERAVRAEDYEAQIGRLEFVQRAGASYRYTGSWLTIFVGADPKGANDLSPVQRRDVARRLEKVHLGGYEAHVPQPVYVALDLFVTVCVRADAFAGEVAAELRRVLSASRLPDGRTGFFHPDRFTFGQPLYRSGLEAAIQATRGVAGVLKIEYRRRGYFTGTRDLPDVLTVAPHEIIRLDNDPNRPDRGTLKITTEGGR